jgi:outer membrane protein assembly factor BamB
VLVGVDGATGHQLFRTQTPGPASLRVTFASDGVVVAERLGCFSADLPNSERGTVMVGYDARTGRERWHQRAGIVTVGPQHGWAQLTPGVLPVRDVATEERMGLDPKTGEVLWSQGVRSDPIRASTRDLLVTSGAGQDGDRLSGVDRATGQTRWSYEVDAARHFQLVAVSDDVVATVVVDRPAATFDQVPEVGVAIHLLSAATGALDHLVPLQLTTTQKMQTSAFQTVDLQITRSILVLDVGELVAFDAHTGAERWRAPGRLDPTVPSPRADVLLARTGAGTGSPVSITALDPHTGRKLWVRGLGRFLYGGAETSSNVVVFERDGYHGIDPKTGQARWQLDPAKGLAGIAGMTSRDLYLVGGCPVTSAD